MLLIYVFTGLAKNDMGLHRYAPTHTHTFQGGLTTPLYNKYPPSFLHPPPVSKMYHPSFKKKIILNIHKIIAVQSSVITGQYLRQTFFILMISRTKNIVNIIFTAYIFLHGSCLSK